MRYYELVEANAATQAAKESQKRLKANKKMNDARRKKSDAAHAYQDKLRSANGAEASARSDLTSA